MKEDQTVAAAYWALSLLLVLCELTPLFAKLLASKDDYDLLLDKQSFRAAEDFDIYQSVYPQIAAQRITEELRLELEKEQLEREQAYTAERLRLPRIMALQSIAEKDAIFEIVERELASMESLSNPKLREITHQVCEQILQTFQSSLAEQSPPTFSPTKVPHQNQAA